MSYVVCMIVVCLGRIESVLGCGRLTMHTKAYLGPFRFPHHISSKCPATMSDRVTASTGPLAPGKGGIDVDKLAASLHSAMEADARWACGEMNVISM